MLGTPVKEQIAKRGGSFGRRIEYPKHSGVY
jgi:hypothetical protein